MRNTKIVATLGPASDNFATISKLVKKGVNVFRLNMSHATHKETGERIAAIRRVAQEEETNVAILMDLQGPKIRLGKFKNGETLLHKGCEFIIDPSVSEGDEKTAGTTYQTISRDVKAGDPILLDDGRLELLVKEVNGPIVITEVITGGTISNHKGMNLPGTKISMPALTAKDMEDLHFACTEDIDYIALSFVRKPEDVIGLREQLRMHRRSDIRIISKIEKPEAISNLDRILELSDAIMIARGDLGVEVGPEMVPGLQKKIILKCNKAGIPVITATQMLDSMIYNPRPTRAEASDVANAILDGTDAVMLSGETAAGIYPCESVEMMDLIIRETESGMHFEPRPYSFFELPHVEPTHAIGYSACRLAQNVEAKLIACFSSEGKMPRRVSKFRPFEPIIAVVHSPGIANRVSLYWGVYPLEIETLDTLNEQIKQATEILLKKGLVRRGERIIVTAGIPLFESGSTNTIKIHTV